LGFKRGGGKIRKTAKLFRILECHRKKGLSFPSSGCSLREGDRAEMRRIRESPRARKEGKLLPQKRSTEKEGSSVQRNLD